MLDETCERTISSDDLKEMKYFMPTVAGRSAVGYLHKVNNEGVRRVPFSLFIPLALLLMVFPAM
jgi:hypothetical protein